MEIKWTSNSLEDLYEIYQFYLYKDERAANAIFNEIVDRSVILGSFPKIAPVEQLLMGYIPIHRSLVVYRGMFKVVYYIEGDSVNIAAVWDCRRSPDRLVKRIK